MPKNLVIVESPAKARTIAGYLGSDFSVKSSFGHIRDLPKKDLSVDVEKGFKPTYVISPDKKKVVKELKTASKNSTVWLASDEDREGEAIAWHISMALGLKLTDVKRIVFHEITKPAISEAIKKPRAIDMKLVDAQQARRVLDRLVGYELSPVLWKKIRPGLSAGRVQSVAVRLIVEREKQIKAFSPKSSFKVTAVFDAEGKEIPAELNVKHTNQKNAHSFLDDLITANFAINQVEKKPGTKSAGAPFTTSTLQQEASRRLGFSVRRTMMLAQRLYEDGHITYMRTDSTNISNLAINSIKSYVEKSYGPTYSRPTQYKTRTRGAQEAHEAIRVTVADKTSAGQDKSQNKLYKLIWSRTIASQMSPAKIEKTEIKISISNREEVFVASGEVLIFDGFLKVYGGGKEDKILPDLKVNQNLKLISAIALEAYDRPAARYTEASLVKKLEELGIGRPSTYAPTIGTIQDRGYIEKKDLEGEEREVVQLNLQSGKIESLKVPIVYGADRSKLVPTELADVVTDFLTKNFADIVDYDFTAKAEEELDEIAEGKLTSEKMLNSFYKRFHPQVEKGEKVSRSEVLRVRNLGQHPKSGKAVIVRYGRFGPVLQLGDTPESKDKTAPKPQFAPLPLDTTMDEVTLERALPMFNLPRIVGQTAEGEEITANIGRFGPYLKVGESFISLKEADPRIISEAEANVLIAEKKQELANRVISDFGDIKILKGPYGPYVTNGKINAKIPKATNPKKITQKKALEILEQNRKKK